MKQRLILLLTVFLSLGLLTLTSTTAHAAKANASATKVDKVRDTHKRADIYYIRAQQTGAKTFKATLRVPGKVGTTKANLSGVVYWVDKNNRRGATVFNQNANKPRSFGEFWVDAAQTKTDYKLYIGSNKIKRITKVVIKGNTNYFTHKDAVGNLTLKFN